LAQLGWTPQTEFDQGLTATIQWYIQAFRSSGLEEPGRLGLHSPAEVR
jgi:dTDP-D-glucose 4,6-dehydratase